jgi:hypothetical protein
VSAANDNPHLHSNLCALLEGLLDDDHRGAFVAAEDQPEHQVRGFGVKRDVADLIALCGYPHSAICADTATMPTSPSWPV